LAPGEMSCHDCFDALPVPAQSAVSVPDFALSVKFIHGYQFAQVYAPVVEDFICFEPMTAPANALDSGDGLNIVAPGESYTACFSIAVRSA
jgi:galactose mutarotase-like enzyme